MAFPPRLLTQVRRVHGAMAPLVLAPLALSALSGMAYRLLKDWAGLGRDQVHWLMVLHEGEWLGQADEPVYVLLNGLGLLWMLVSGGLLVLQRWQRHPSRQGAGPGAGPEGAP
jgi:hypothetical protein